MIRPGRAALDNDAPDGQDSGELWAKPSREVLAQGPHRGGIHLDRRGTGDLPKSGEQPNRGHLSAESAKNRVSDLFGKRRVVAVLGVAERSP
jgi:hypothetical protein